MAAVGERVGRGKGPALPELVMLGIGFWVLFVVLLVSKPLIALGLLGLLLVGALGWLHKAPHGETLPEETDRHWFVS